MKYLLIERCDRELKLYSLDEAHHDATATWVRVPNASPVTFGRGSPRQPDAPDVQVVGEPTLSRMHFAIARLPLSSKEVAAQLGLSDAAVRQRLHRARQLVAERLRPEVRGAASITCGGNLDLLQDAIDHDLVGDLVAEVAAHIGECVICQGLRGHYEDTIAAPRRWQPELATERAASVVARILAEVER